MFHFNFFKGNRYPYATHSSPNSEHDGLHIARAARTLNSENLKTELTEAGNPSLALESLSRMQGFDTSACLLYTSPSPRDVEESRMPSSA